MSNPSPAGRGTGLLVAAEGEGEGDDLLPSTVTLALPTLCDSLPLPVGEGP